MDGIRGTFKICYLTEIVPGRLMGVFMWTDREAYPEKGAFNADTEGCLPTRILLSESDDLEPPGRRRGTCRWRRKSVRQV